jgi:hypothetical protein
MERFMVLVGNSAGDELITDRFENYVLLINGNFEDQLISKPTEALLLSQFAHSLSDCIALHAMHFSNEVKIGCW